MIIKDAIGDSGIIIELEDAEAIELLDDMNDARYNQTNDGNHCIGKQFENVRYELMKLLDVPDIQKP